MNEAELSALDKHGGWNMRFTLPSSGALALHTTDPCM